MDITSERPQKVVKPFKHKMVQLKMINCHPKKNAIIQHFLITFSNQHMKPKSFKTINNLI